MSQRWCDLLFVHWQVPAEALRPLVPPPLEIDTYEGTAWIGAVPFRMEAVHPRRLPSVPWLSAFPELNLRTYVKLDDRPGVFFFSLDATNPVAVAVARRWFHLPYFRARITCTPDGDGFSYNSVRRHPGAPSARFAGHYRPTGEVFHAVPGTLDHFLTERYCLYASPASVGGTADEIFRAEVDHPPWPLQPAEASIKVNTLSGSMGISGVLEPTPRLLFSRALDVKVWPPDRVMPTHGRRTTNAAR